HGVSASPNEVVFMANSTLMIPANQTIPPGFCSLEFDVKILARSTDPTPNEIEQTTGYLAAQNDAKCDNGLTSSGQQSSSIPLCPACTSTPCLDSVCNQMTGMCVDTANDDQLARVTTCPDDTNPCTGPPACNPQTGMCEFPNLPDSTPCPDTDANSCTTAGCDTSGNCDQNHIICVTTTTSTTTTTII